LKQKAKEVRECLEENVQYYIWLSAYLISQRVLKEENFLQTYADVVEELSIKSSVRPPFNVMIREELVSAIKGQLIFIRVILRLYKKTINWSHISKI
jgi:hypothetical protein